jgi:hypothetical protein
MLGEDGDSHLGGRRFMLHLISLTHLKKVQCSKMDVKVIHCVLYVCHLLLLKKYYCVKMMVLLRKCILQNSRALLLLL